LLNSRILNFFSNAFSEVQGPVLRVQCENIQQGFSTCPASAGYTRARAFFVKMSTVCCVSTSKPYVWSLLNSLHSRRWFSQIWRSV
jgi:hypothetical protein